MHVVHGERADLEEAGAGVDVDVGLDRVRLQRLRDQQRLDRRAGLEAVDHGAVAQAGGVAVIRAVGVVAGLAGQGQDVAGMRVRHHDQAALGAVLLHRALQLAVGQVLQAQVQGQVDVLAGLGLGVVIGVLDHMAGAVSDHPARTRRAAQRGVLRRLDAFLTLAVDVAEADHVRRHLARRVVAAVLALREHAGRAEGDEALGLVRVDLPLEVDELAVGALAQEALELARGEAEQLGHGVDVGRRVEQVLRHNPDRIDRRRQRQRLAVAVAHRAAVGLQHHGAHLAQVALAGEEVVLHHLQVEGTAQHRRGEHAHQAERGLAAPVAGLVRAQLEGGAHCGFSAAGALGAAETIW